MYFEKEILYGINKEKIDCDYYRYLAGDPYAMHEFREEYMLQYSTWSYETMLKLQGKIYEE